MTELLMGMETEYAVVGLSPAGERIEQDWLMERLMDHAVATLPHLPVRVEPGIFLPNAGRLYVDAGGHLEFSTPECSSPAEVVRYVQAGDRIVHALAAELAARDPQIGEIAILRSNVDYLAGTTWGCHESYLYRGRPDRLAEQLLPLLASRVVLGAGGFDIRVPGIAFVLSPRAPFIESASSSSSVVARGLFHTKDEALAGHGYRRLHLICGESLTSELGTYVKLGSTALAVAMAEAGLDPADGVELVDPVGALSVWNGDPSLSARARGRRQQTFRALDVQRHYLRRAEAARGRSFMPGWARPLCAAWRAALDALERDPLLLDRALDWPIKRALFAGHAARAGFPWGGLRAWNRRARARLEPAGMALEPPADPGWTRFIHLRHALFALDMRFAQVGPAGLATRLEGQGGFRHRIGAPWSLEHALWTAPSRGRARIRGRVIGRLVRRRGRATLDWAAVEDGRGRLLDLSDPLERRERWLPGQPIPADSRPPAGMRLRRVLTGHGDRVTWVAWAGDGRLGSASRDGTARIWDPASGACRRALVSRRGAVTAIAWGPAGRVATLAEGQVRIWDGASGMVVAESGPEPAARCLSWATPAGADGHLSIGSDDGLIRLLTHEGALVGVLGGHPGAVHGVAWSPDAATLASASEHGDVALWSGRERALIGRLHGHQGAVRAVAFSPDGQRIASGADDSTIRVWDAPARTLMVVLRAHQRGISEVAWSADGAVLAARGEDKALRLWRTDTWTEIGAIHDGAAERWPRGLAFHPREPWLALPDAGRAIQLWELDPATLLSRP